MALSLVRDTQSDPPVASLNGVYQGQTDPVYLGLNGLSTQIGNFYIGFDNYLKPAMVRVFYDPIALQKHLVNSYVGLVQFGQITYQGVPITPTTYGMGLDFLQPYTTSTLSNQAQNIYGWVNMLDATRAKNAQIGFPFFAFNAFLRNPTLKISDFFIYPQPNGCLVATPPVAQPPPNTSLCASLFDAIDLDLDSPPEAEITAYLKTMAKRGVEPDKSQIYTRSQVQNGSALDFALAMLEITDFDTVDTVEVVGPYILITMDDVEDEGPMFVAYYDANQATSNSETMVIYELNLDEMEELRFATVSQTFANIQAELIANGWLPKTGFPRNRPRDAKGKGGAGLNPFPFFFPDFVNEDEEENDDDYGPEIAFNYRVIAFAFPGEGNPLPAYALGGFSWSVGRAFSPAALEFGPLRIYEPRELDFSDIPTLNAGLIARHLESQQQSLMYRALRQFQTAVQNPNPTDQSVPTFFEDTAATTRSSRNFSGGSPEWIGS